MTKYKKMSERRFVQCIDKISDELKNYIKREEIKVDYIVPILRSGGVPAIYLSNRLNIIKFAPIQIKHIAYKNGSNKIEVIYNSLEDIQIKKDNPVFLVVDAMQSSGTSVEICLKEIIKIHKNAKIIYVCVSKEYGSKDFKNITCFETCGLKHKGRNKFTKKQCKDLGIEYFDPLFSWEILDFEINHPDDLEENIFF